MNTTSEWIKTCINKKKYDEGFADMVIKKAKEDRGIFLYKYFCPHCSGWHLTNKPRMDVTLSEKLSALQKENESLKKEIEKLRSQSQMPKMTPEERAILRKDSYIQSLLIELKKKKSNNKKLRNTNKEIVGKLATQGIKK